jgi:hypothetical protein
MAMRVMVIVKANVDSEAGKLPDASLLAEMARFNEELVNARVLLAGEGLHASSAGVRVRFDGDDRGVEFGPFADVESMVAGYWIWQVKSREEAIEWLVRAPFSDAEVELRPILDVADFASADPVGDLLHHEQALRERVDTSPPDQL